MPRSTRPIGGPQEFEYAPLKICSVVNISSREQQVVYQCVLFGRKWKESHFKRKLQVSSQFRNVFCLHKIFPLHEVLVWVPIKKSLSVIRRMRTPILAMVECLEMIKHWSISCRSWRPSFRARIPYHILSKWVFATGFYRKNGGAERISLQAGACTLSRSSAWWR